MDYGFDELGDIFRRNYEREQERMGKLNILIIGKTGVGKSTLINSVFGQDLAKTGAGEPVTDHLQKYEKPGTPMVLYDTKGFEISNEREIRDEFDRVVNDYKKTGKEEDYIHFAWYCINTQSRRIEQFEIEMIKELSKHDIPVILVLTQHYGEAAREFSGILRTISHGANSIVEVVAKPIIIDESENLVVKQKGLEKLIDETLLYLPETKKKAFIMAQRVNIDLKRKKARNEVNLFIAANAGVGFVPIPFSDAPVMISLELAMLARIAVIFSSNFGAATKTVLPALIGAGGATGATILGKTIVANLLKLIPGVGTVAGGAISAATAAVLTGALGYAYIEVMCTIEESKNKTGKVYSDAEFVGMLKVAFVDALKNKKTTQDT